jgi:PAS domain S-box-containing protein
MTSDKPTRELHELREEARALLNSIEDYAIFLLGADGTVLTWNAGARRYTGYEENEIVGRSFEVFYSEDDRKAGLPQRLLGEARDHGRVENEGWRFRKDGTRFWADVIMTALRGDDGELRGFLIVTRDLTGREAERRTRLSEQSLRMLLASIKDYAIFMLDPAGRIISWNAGAERTKGYRADEVIGRHIAMFYPPIDVQRGRPQRLLEEAREHGRIEDEGWRVRKDGTQFWADVILSRIDDDAGHLVGFAKITRDLTERRRAEDQLRVRARQQASIAEVGLFALQTRDLGTLFDRTGTIVAQTLEMELVRVLERGSDGKLLVRSATGWPDTFGRALERPDDLLAEQGVRSGAQVAIQSAGHGGLPYGYLGVYSRDRRELSTDDAYFLQAVANVLSSAVTRRRMETQLRLAESQAEIERIRATRAHEQVRERDDFLSVAAHELRTPLTALQLKLQSIETVWRKKPGEAIAAKFEARIEGALRQVERLTELVERLLDVSRIAQGRLALTVENVDLVAIAREVIDDLAPAAEQARSELRLLAPEALMGAWDRGRLQQALVNVITNAIKYGGGKPVDIRIEQKDSHVKVAIEDRGIGISEQDHDRIFQRFERAAPLRHYGGLGLGLYITRHIIEAHGGRVWLHSTKGAGSTFTLELPLRSAPLQPSDNMGALNE